MTNLYSCGHAFLATSIWPNMR